MKRRVIALLLGMVFVSCSCMTVFTTIGMGRVWGSRAACSIGSSSEQDLSLLTSLYPNLVWTAYTQSLPRQIQGDEMSRRSADIAVLSFRGAPDRIAFFPLVTGRLPLDGEHGVCALDKDNAFQLFGSTDPGEAVVRLDGEFVRVVGVIDAPRPLMLIPAQNHASGRSEGNDVNQQLQAVTFDRLVADDRETLLTLASALGAEPDPFELSGAELQKLAWLLCAVPWILVAALMLTTLRRRGGVWRIAGMALLCALALCALLEVLLCIPVRLLPNRWSDLAFYGEQITAWKARPFRITDVRDELLKSDMMRVGLWCAVTCVTLWMKRRWLRCGKSH